VISYSKNIDTPAQDSIPKLNKGHSVVYTLESKDIRFIQLIFNHPLLRRLKIAVLNDEWYKQIPKENPNYICRTMLARSSGENSLPLHIDSFIPSSGKYTWVLQIAVALEDFNFDNGCTLVVPGSHLEDRYAKQEDLSDAIPLELKAGDIVAWDSRLWHGANPNNSKKTRWSIIGTFTRWWVKQNYNMKMNMPNDIYQNLSDEEKSILGFCCMPPDSEYDRIDIKGGYNILPKSLKNQKGNK